MGGADFITVLYTEFLRVRSRRIGLTPSGIVSSSIRAICRRCFILRFLLPGTIRPKTCSLCVSGAA